MKQSKIEKMKQELANVEEILKKQKHSTKDCLENAHELLNELESKKNAQSLKVKEYQKTDKYKEYKKQYMRKYKFNKVKQLGNDFIDNRIEKDRKDYKNDHISSKEFIKFEKKHLSNKELLDELDNLKDYKNLFIVFYGKTNYKNHLVL